MDVTAPIKAIPEQVPVKNTAAGQGRKNLWTSIRVLCRIYSASLVQTGVVVPIIVSLVTVSLYISTPFPLLPHFLQELNSGWYSIISGIFITYIMWLVAAAICWPFSTARGAHSRTYQLLEGRYHHLKCLGINQLSENPTLEDLQKADLIEKKGAFNLLALKEAQAHYADLDELLHSRIANTGLDWVTGMGYVTAWNTIHRAEEALIEVMPTEMVILGAIHDKLAIQDSTISHRDELLDKLMQAVNDLDPKATVYFKEHQPDQKNDEMLRKVLEVVNKSNIGLVGSSQSVDKVVPGVKPGDSAIILTVDKEAQKAVDLEIQTRARVALREVRRSLNSFRDQLWERLLRARNKLLGAMTFTGIFTHILLVIVLLAISKDTKSSNLTAIEAATAIYMVGAVAGLFGRLYAESRNSAAFDDYGLSLARLTATPLLSGLAAVGGVLITALLFASTFGRPDTGSSMLNLAAIFSSFDPRYLLAAAIFGLTPNLIIRTLQQQSEKYVSGLQSSKGANQQ